MCQRVIETQIGVSLRYRTKQIPIQIEPSREGALIWEVKLAPSIANYLN